MFICIDESGDVGRYPPSPSPYFLIAAIFAKNKYNLDGVISRVRRNRRKAGKKLPAEIKYSNTDTNIKNHIIKEIGLRSCMFVGIGVDKRMVNYSNISSCDRIYLKTLHNVFLEILSAYPNETSYLIHIDRGMASSHYDEVRYDFYSILKTVNPYYSGTVQIECLVSEASEPIQQADFIAGEIHRHYRCEMESDGLWELIQSKALKIDILNKI